MRNRRVVIATFVVLGLAATSACSSDTSRKSDKPSSSSTRSTKTTEPTPTKTDAPSPSATSSKLATNQTIVISVCSSDTAGNRQLWFIDPKTGEIVEKRFFAIGDAAMTNATISGQRSVSDCNSNLLGSNQRYAFDSTFENVVVQRMFVDGQRHIGTVPMSTTPVDFPESDIGDSSEGDSASDPTGFVDLSGHAAETTGDTPDTDNDFAPDIEQSAGSFGPDGLIYFVQETDDGVNKVLAVNPETLKVKTVKDPGTEIGRNTSSDGEVVFDRYAPQPATGNIAPEGTVYSPDGKNAIWINGTGISFGSKPSMDAPATEFNPDTSVTPFGYIAPAEFYSYHGAGSVNGSQIFRSVIVGRDIKSEPLLPENPEGDIIDPTLGADGIYFILSDEDSRALYRLNPETKVYKPLMQFDDEQLNNINLLEVPQQ